MASPAPQDGPGVAPPFGARNLMLLLILAGVWGATFPVARLGVAGGASPFFLVGIDFLLATGVMVALCVLRGEPRPARVELLTSIPLGVLLIGGINLLLFWGVQFTTGGVAAIVFATAPLLSLCASFALGRGERLSAVAAIALVVGLLGVVVLGLGSSGARVVTNPWGLLALAGGAASQGVGAALIARYRPRGETTWGQSMQFAGGAAAGFVALPLAGRAISVPATPPVIASILYLALLTGVLGYSVYFRLIHRAGATRANLVTYLNPLVALAVGVAALGEAVSLPEIAGLLLVLIALLLLQLPGRRRMV